MREVQVFGQTFALSEEISPFAMLEFAEAASDGQDGDTMEGLASMLRFVKECIATEDVVVDGKTAFGRARFLSEARKNRAGAKELLPVLEAVFGGKTERPTSRPSDSSDGPEGIVPSSPSSSDVKVSNRFDGRPDLKLALSRVA